MNVVFVVHVLYFCLQSLYNLPLSLYLFYKKNKSAKSYLSFKILCNY